MSHTLNLEYLTSAMSHDLRAPPRRIEGFAALLRESIAPVAGTEAARLLDSIEFNALETSRMLTELLEWVRLAGAPLSPQAVDLGKIAREAWVKLESSGRAGAATLEIGSLPLVNGDLAMLQALMEHLLSNAAKFSAKQPGAQVGLEGTLDGSQVRICVRDNGAGFDEKYAARIFHPFSRLHTAKEFEGRGMGLALADVLVSRHGGQLSASSSPGLGARLEFTLPAAPA